MKAFMVAKFHGQEIENIQKASFITGGPFRIETRPLICGENQWTGFYMIRTRHERVKFFEFSPAFRQPHQTGCNILE